MIIIVVVWTLIGKYAGGFAGGIFGIMIAIPSLFILFGKLVNDD